jgi:hypothetical protein
VICFFLLNCHFCVIEIAMHRSISRLLGSEYSNKETPEALKWFWEHFDATGFSIWKVSACPCSVVACFCV